MKAGTRESQHTGDTAHGETWGTRFSVSLVVSGIGQGRKSLPVKLSIHRCQSICRARMAVARVQFMDRVRRTYTKAIGAADIEARKVLFY